MNQIMKHLDQENRDLSPNIRLLETRCQVLSRKRGGPLGLSFTFMKRSKVDFWGHLFSLVQSLSHVWLYHPMDWSTPGFPVHHKLPEFTQTHVHWAGDAIQPSHPLSSPFPPAFNLHIRWPKYWSFSLSISPSNEYSGLISFRMDWLDLLVVQGTLKSLLQHCNSKTSILRHSAFFIVQLSHLYTTTEKRKALTRWTFVSKVVSLLFRMLSRLVITFFFKEQVSFNFMDAGHL